MGRYSQGPGYSPSADLSASKDHRHVGARVGCAPARWASSERRSHSWCVHSGGRCGVPVVGVDFRWAGGKNQRLSERLSSRVCHGLGIRSWREAAAFSIAQRGGWYSEIRGSKSNLSSPIPTSCIPRACVVCVLVVRRREAAENVLDVMAGGVRWRRRQGQRHRGQHRSTANTSTSPPPCGMP